MESVTLERKLTAILSADVVGYSRLMGDDHEATVETLLIRALGTAAQRDLRFLGQRSETHVGDEQRDVELQRLAPHRERLPTGS